MNDNINLKFEINNIWNNNDIDSLINRIDVLIYNDNSIVGTMKLVTSPVNIMDLDFDNRAFDVWDNSDINTANVFYKLLNEKHQLNIDSFPDEFKEVEYLDYLSLIIIEEYKILKDFRGNNISKYVFSILKHYFINHLFILKAFPLEDDDYDVNKDFAVSKLTSLYFVNGFRNLNIKSEDSYMILLNTNLFDEEF